MYLKQLSLRILGEWYQNADFIAKFYQNILLLRFQYVKQNNKKCLRSSFKAKY